MADKKAYQSEVEIPEGVSVTYEENMLKAKGPKGETEKKLVHPRLSVKIEGQKIILSAPLAGTSARDKMHGNTFRSHMNNLVKGVVQGYTAKMKICSGHFPMTVTTDGKRVIVKNFFGEKVPRTSNVMPGVKVAVQGDEITLEGLNKEAVSQMAARIELSTKITNRDKRTFQDGCYITQKAVLNDE
jgi:large subunit ribosomal protein L6